MLKDLEQILVVIFASVTRRDYLGLLTLKAERTVSYRVFPLDALNIHLCTGFYAHILSLQLMSFLLLGFVCVLCVL